RPAPAARLPGGGPSRTGSAPRRTSTRAPGSKSTIRRPSHHITAPGDAAPADSKGISGVCGAGPRPEPPMTSMASTDRGETTIGRANSAGALIGTISRASTSGHTTGPPAENAYAVEPVGVAHTTPSQPQR